MTLVYPEDVRLAGASFATTLATHGGGALSAGVSAAYRKVWDTGLQLTYFFGSEEFQALRDWTFLSLRVQRAF